MPRAITEDPGGHRSMETAQHRPRRPTRSRSRSRLAVASAIALSAAASGARGAEPLEVAVSPPPSPPAPIHPPSERSGDPPFDRTLDVSLHASAARLVLDHRLRASNPPAPLAGADVRLHGDVPAFLFALRTGITAHGLRFGVGAGVGRASGDVLETSSLAPGSSASADGAWLTPVEGYVGFAWGAVRTLRPYVELRGGFYAAHVPIRARGADGHEESRVHRAVMSFVAGRVGAIAWLSQYFFVDFGIGAGVGVERLSASVGLGLPIPLSHLLLHPEPHDGGCAP